MIFLPPQMPPLQTVPLTSLIDEGEAMRDAEPLFAPLVRQGKVQMAKIEIGTVVRTFWIVEEGGAPILYFDANGNGRREPGEKIKTGADRATTGDGKEMVMYPGTVQISLGHVRAQYGVRFFVSDTTDPAFDSVRNKLVLYAQTCYSGQATLGGKVYKIGVRGLDPRTSRLYIDRDGNGYPGSSASEDYPLSQPFSLGGVSYQAEPPILGESPSITFWTVRQKVDEIPMPPDLSVGQIAPSLTGKTLSGEPFAFPKGYSGKLVLLDVWATWCGPCLAETPYLKAAYTKHKAQGFEIVGVSIDDPNLRGKVMAKTKEKGMDWPQVYEGMGWMSPVCRRYNLNSIPFLLLVDGDSGKILASGDDLRGEKLETTLAAKLTSRAQTAGMSRGPLGAQVKPAFWAWCRLD